MDCSTLGFPVHHQLPELAQTHVHWVGDAIQPSHPLSSPSPPTFTPSQHQSLFQWVSSSRQVVKVLEFQLQHQSFQWIFRSDFLYDGLVGSSCSPRDSQESSPTPQFKSINSLAFKFLFFFSFIFICWRRITLQYCSGFCHILTWISHGFTCVPHPNPSSRLPPHPLPLGLPSAPAWHSNFFRVQFSHPYMSTEKP